MSLLNPCRVISQPRGIRLIFGWDLLISGFPRQLKKNVGTDKKRIAWAVMHRHENYRRVAAAA